MQRDELPLLEYIMKGCKRENVAIMGRRRSGNMVRCSYRDGREGGGGLPEMEEAAEA